MIARAAPLIGSPERFLAAYLVAERLCDLLRNRAALRARPGDGCWDHFIDSSGGICSELRR